MKNDIIRFAFIETRLLWGGGLTARQLADAFGLARQNAQKVISQYRQRHPENIRRVGRKQVASSVFTPYYIRSGARNFLDYLRGQSMLAYYLDIPDWIDMPFHDVDHLLRGRLHNSIMHEMLAALREKRVVTLYYHAKTGARMRDFSPNQLIFASNRYHIRGFCHLTLRYLDFVLSRITHAEPADREWVSSDDDREWNSFDILLFRPNPELPEEAINALRLDFALGLDDNDSFQVKCRRALKGYVKRAMLVPDSVFEKPRWIQSMPISSREQEPTSASHARRGRRD